MVEAYSVLMAVYHKETGEFFSQAINSILTQTVPTDDFVIVCDGELTLELDAVINHYINKHPNIFNIVRLTERHGFAWALDRGLEQCKNEIICRMDSDDISVPKRCEKQIALMRLHNADVLSGSLMEFRDKPNDMSSMRVLPEKHKDILRFAKRRSPFNQPCVMFRKSKVTEVGGYSPRNDKHKHSLVFEDYYLWVRMLMNKSTSYNAKEVLLYMRTGSGMYKRHGGLRYFIAMMKFKNHIRQIGFSSLRDFLICIPVHFVSCLAPVGIRKLLYANFLRDKSTNKSLIYTIKSYLYTRIFLRLKSNPTIQAHSCSDISEELPIAMVSDQMTWKSLSKEHSAILLTPKTWKKKLQGQKVKLFFCEATWSGTVGDCWRGQVYKDERVLYENRRDLLNILEYCKKENIPTVFWAKEDPIYFNHSVHNFTDTALLFDTILATSIECISKYEALGHKNVHLWTFGFSTNIFYPPRPDVSRENVAVFAGSWFLDHPHRCEDLEKIFDMILERKIPLRIYDRHRSLGKSTKPFPEKYEPYVMDNIPYEELGDIYRNVKYVINVNTVRDSETMFSRRIYEAMACGAVIITNQSQGLQKQFGKNVWFFGENFDFESIENIRIENINMVFSYHTLEGRMVELCKILSNYNIMDIENKLGK